MNQRENKSKHSALEIMNHKYLKSISNSLSNVKIFPRTNVSVRKLQKEAENVNFLKIHKIKN